MEYLNWRVQKKNQIEQYIEKYHEDYKNWLRETDLEDSPSSREFFFPTAFRIECDEVVEEWAQIGGCLNSQYNNYSSYNALYICEDDEYARWLKGEELEDTEENAKNFCRTALENCGAYSDKEIDEIMRKCWN